MGCTPSTPKKITPKPGNAPETENWKFLRSAILIQKWYRRYTARLEIRRRCTWNVFQCIEYSGEQDQLKLQNFFNTMLTGMEVEEDGIPRLIKVFNLNKRPSIYDTRSMEDEELGNFDIDVDSITVERSYKGPHLTFPLTLNQLHAMVQSFKRCLPLHAKYTIQLLVEVRRLLKQQPNIRYASTSLSKQFTICGDIHGKLSDLYMIFHKNGLPSVTNPYIFNGDFVDRGHFSTEVALVLFACFLMNPNEVFINRGNHEDHVMNLRYGFVKELSQKYKEYSKQVTKLFADVFSWLPLATVVDEQILVCHGGISATTDLKTLANIDRHRYVSILQPPGGLDITTLSTHDLFEWKQVLDLLWSDPRPADGCVHNEFRGGGCYFGPDITREFLRKNKLKLLVRSHECKQEGYEYTHDDQVLTIFSASSYYEVGSNKGAYIQLRGPDLSCHIVQYTTCHSNALRKTTFTQRVNVTEKSAIKNLKQRIIGSQIELMAEFQKYDPLETGKIDKTEWTRAMENVLTMDLPWRTLSTKLVQVDEDGMVIYKTSFEELRVQHRYSGNGPSITETLYRHRDSLETIFRLMDTDHSGCISMQEFEDALTILIRQMNISVAEMDIRDIAKSLDINNDGNIDFNEFLEAFRIVDAMGKDSTTAFATKSSTEADDISSLALSSQIEANVDR